jgi:hypothetical protein
MKLSIVTTLSGLAFAALIGCGGDDAAPITFAQLPAKLATAQCSQTFRCCDSAEIMARFNGTNPPVTTEAECVTFYTGLFMTFLTDEPVTAGRQAYDASAAGSCIADFESRSCTDTSDAPTSCEGVFVGKVAAAGMCKDDEDCAVSGSYCDGDTSTAFGTCKTKPAVGAACTEACVDTAFCDQGGTGNCVALKANGAACNLDEECTSDTCNASNLCAAAPLVCDGN